MVIMVEEQQIKRRLQGIMAEKIFELLFTEIGCQVFRTGQEFLYPTLLNLANTKKKFYHEKYKETDYENLCKEMGFTWNDGGFSLDKGEWVYDIEREELPEKSDVATIRFSKRIPGISLATSPDFTIITPSGNMEQVEVKYRSNGELSLDEQQKYLVHIPRPLIFIVMNKPPYIELLVPWVVKFHGKETKFNEKLSSIFILSNHMKVRMEDPEDELKAEYGYLPIPREVDGSMVIGRPFYLLKSEELRIPIRILNKYEKAIKEIFIF